jgi:hypothetical protein
VSAHDAYRRGEAQAGSLPDSLRREERVEDPAEDIGGDPAAGIRHGYLIAASRGDPRARMTFGHPDPDSAALRHRIARVHQQVQQDLLKGREISRHSPFGTRFGVRHKFDLRRKARAGEGDRFRDELSQRDEFVVFHGRPAVIQEAPHKLRAPFARRLRIVEQRDRVAVVRQSFAREIDVPEDGRQQVVEGLLPNSPKELLSYMIDIDLFVRRRRDDGAAPVRPKAVL